MVSNLATFVLVSSMAVGQANQAPSNHEHLKPLSWAIGTWVVEAEATEAGPGVEVGDKVKTTFAMAWDLGKNVITTHIISTANGEKIWENRGFVAWHPAEKVIFSRGFDSVGGHGQLIWTKDGETWKLKGYAIDAEGAKTTHTIVLSNVSEKSWTAQTINRMKDGESLPDNPEATWTRMK